MTVQRTTQPLRKFPSMLQLSASTAFSAMSSAKTCPELQRHARTFLRSMHAINCTKCATITAQHPISCASLGVLMKTSLTPWPWTPTRLETHAFTAISLSLRCPPLGPTRHTELALLSLTTRSASTSATSTYGDNLMLSPRPQPLCKPRGLLYPAIFLHIHILHINRLETLAPDAFNTLPLHFLDTSFAIIPRLPSTIALPSSIPHRSLRCCFNFATNCPLRCCFKNRFLITLCTAALKIASLLVASPPTKPALLPRPVLPHSRSSSKSVANNRYQVDRSPSSQSPSARRSPRTS